MHYTTSLESMIHIFLGSCRHVPDIPFRVRVTVLEDRVVHCSEHLSPKYEQLLKHMFFQNVIFPVKRQSS